MDVLGAGAAQFQLFGSTEKTAIVLDIGAAYTKCGFAGDAHPRCIVPTNLVSYDGRKVNANSIRDHV